MLVIASVVLMMVDHRQDHLGELRSALGLLVFPIHGLASLPETGGEWLAESFATRRQLQEENANLRAQQLVLQAQLQKLETLQSENMRLRELLKSSRQIGERMLIAEILSVDLAPFSRQIVLNKGSGSDIYEGQPIVDANGIMGQVVSVTPISSVAMLISDPSHAVPVAVNRTGLRAIALGTGTSNNLDVPYIPNNADIQVGDLLVTSGLGGRFPPNYPVAKVIQVDKNPSRPFAKVVAEATANLDRSREVLLIWGKEPGKAPCAPGDVSCTATVSGVTEPSSAKDSGVSAP